MQSILCIHFLLSTSMELGVNSATAYARGLGNINNFPDAIIGILNLTAIWRESSILFLRREK